MKGKKEILMGLVVIAVIAAGVAGVTVYQKNKSRNSLAARIAELSAGTPPQTIEELRRAITLYEERIEEHVRDAAKTGVYWKILATRLADRGLHREALDALDRAISYYPLDVSLHYLTGVSAALVAKSVQDFAGTGADRGRYYALAEAGYLRAVELDDRYARARYGLGVLYVFELNRPQDAIPHLLRYLELNTRDVDAMFILARGYYMTGQYQEAVELYDRIGTLTKDADKRTEAANNKQLILDGPYG